jgi:2-oxoglutarate ferredoxin oxidoreductase subunit delta
MTSNRYWRVPLDTGDVLRIRGNINILEERCKGCSYCVEFCPRHVLKLSDRFNTKGYHPPDVVTAEDCTACHLCELICPEFAIGISEVTYKEASGAS